MKKFGFKKFLCLVSVLMVSGCLIPAGPKEAKKVPFKGEWKIVTENGINGNVEEKTETVYTDGRRFRIESEYKMSFYNNESTCKNITVYDGKSISVKTLYPEENTSYDDFGGEDMGFAREITLAESKMYMYWTRAMGGKAGPGGEIAGRETTLYQVKSVRPDGELTAQSWLDAENGTTLKSIEIIFSKQVNCVVTKTSYECLNISYEDIEESIFSL